jgi:hypothetical protein
MRVVVALSCQQTLARFHSHCSRRIGGLPRPQARVSPYKWMVILFSPWLRNRLTLKAWTRRSPVRQSPNLRFSAVPEGNSSPWMARIIAIAPAAAWVSGRHGCRSLWAVQCD